MFLLVSNSQEFVTIPNLKGGGEEVVVEPRKAKTVRIGPPVGV